MPERALTKCPYGRYRGGAREVIEEGVEAGELGVEGVDDASGETGEDVLVVGGDVVADGASEGEGHGVRERELVVDVTDVATHRAQPVRIHRRRGVARSCGACRGHFEFAVFVDERLRRSGPYRRPCVNVLPRSWELPRCNRCGAQHPAGMGGRGGAGVEGEGGGGVHGRTARRAAAVGIRRLSVDVLRALTRAVRRRV